MPIFIRVNEEHNSPSHMICLPCTAESTPARANLRTIQDNVKGISLWSCRNDVRPSPKRHASGTQQIHVVVLLVIGGIGDIEFAGFVTTRFHVAGHLGSPCEELQPLEHLVFLRLLTLEAFYPTHLNPGSR